MIGFVVAATKNCGLYLFICFCKGCSSVPYSKGDMKGPFPGHLGNSTSSYRGSVRNLPREKRCEWGLCLVSGRLIDGGCIFDHLWFVSFDFILQFQVNLSLEVLLEKKFVPINSISFSGRTALIWKNENIGGLIHLNKKCYGLTWTNAMNGMMDLYWMDSKKSEFCEYMVYIDLWRAVAEKRT